MNVLNTAQFTCEALKKGDIILIGHVHVTSQPSEQPILVYSIVVTVETAKVQFWLIANISVTAGHIHVK